MFLDKKLLEEKLVEMAEDKVEKWRKPFGEPIDHLRKIVNYLKEYETDPYKASELSCDEELLRCEFGVIRQELDAILKNIDREPTSEMRRLVRLNGYCLKKVNRDGTIYKEYK